MTHISSRIDRRNAHTIARSRLPAFRRLLSHPLALFAVLCAGVILSNVTMSVADDLAVSASIDAPALTQGAVIVVPGDGAVVYSAPLTVSGSCPANSYVKLFRNGAFSGLAWCNAGTFSVDTALSPGRNSLQAQDYNITDNSGPASTPVDVTYAVPVPPIVPPAQVAQLQKSAGLPPQAPARPSSLPLLATANFSFKTFTTSGTFSWELELGGGATPYTVQTDWGDGSSTIQSAPSSGKITIRHRYVKPGYYPVKVHAIDASGNQTYLQLAALIKTPASIGFNGAKFGPGASPANQSGKSIRLKPWIYAAWSSYGVVLLMVISFWLGERREYHIMKSTTKLTAP